jgi:hypothetical protein
MDVYFDKANLFSFAGSTDKEKSFAFCISKSFVYA